MTVVWIAILGWPLIASESASGQDTPDIKWLTGRKLDEFNQVAISAWWSDAELRERIMGFSRNQQFAIFLDRRVDPSTIIELSVQDVTKEQFLWSVAESSNLGVCRIEDFYYFGPAETAAKLPAVCQQLIRSTSKKRKNAKVDWSLRRPLKTDSIIEPKQILLDLADKNRFQIENPEAIEHDIWAGFELPNTSLQIRVAILLIGFGKTFERNDDGSIIKIVDLPDIKATEATFGKLDNPQSMAQALRSKFPGLKINVRGKRLVASGPPMQISEVQRLIVAAQKPTGVNSADKTFTFTTHSQRGVVLATVAQGANLVLVFDKSNRELVKTLTEPIEVRAVNASLVELVQQALDGTNLKYDLVDRELRVTER